jgi:hypothetical protein
MNDRIRSAHIEHIGGIAASTVGLTEKDLYEIGEFTRENILVWLENHHGPDWVGTLPTIDFHAVYGDIDIPWEQAASRKEWERLHPASRPEATLWTGPS